MQGSLSDNKLEYIFPTVVNVQTKGTKKIYWTIKVLLFDDVSNDSIASSEAMSEAHYIPIKAEYWTTKAGDPTMSNIKAEIIVESGLEGGVIRSVVPTIVEQGKNLGRANETNVFTQALRDANGLWTKKMRGAAVADNESFESLLWPPMLASPPKADNLADSKADGSTNIKTVLVQPKLNGVRAVAFTLSEATASKAPLACGQSQPVGSVIIYSRDRKLYYRLNHIRAELVALFDASDYDLGQIYFDGELYKHGESLQKVSGMARRQLVEKPSDSIKETILLDYMIFDCFVPSQPDLSNDARQGLLIDMWAKVSHILSTTDVSPQAKTSTVGMGLKYVQLVPTIRSSMAEVSTLYKKFMAQGYEGAIARVPEAPYEYSNNKYHSKNLIKFKPFFEEEYTVVGLTSGTNGKAAKAIMLICETKTGLKFTVTPAMTIKEREELLVHLSIAGNAGPVANDIFNKFYLGKPYTVRYDELSDDGIPVRARGIAIRDYE
jgi:hypothetical protein